MKHRLGWFTGLIALAFILIAAQQVHGYTDPANCTSAALSDTRVNPGQSVTWTPGLILDGVGAPVGNGNSSLSFNGVDQYVEVTADASLLPANSISIEFWLKMTAADMGTNGYYGFVCRDTRANGLQVTKQWSTGKINLESPTIGSLTSSVALTPDIWNHVVAVLNSGTSAAIYINGELRGSNAGWALPTTSMDYWVGRAAATTTNPYHKGGLDEIRIYANRVLSPTEIAQHYQGIYINEANLVLYLDFDGEALDQSVEGNDGTLNGGPAYTNGWASVPISTYYNGTISVNSRRILVDSTTGTPRSTVSDTSPAGVGVYTATLAPDNSIGNGTITGFIVDQYLVSLGVLFHEVEASFSGALYATGSSVVDGHSLTAGDTVTIDGVHLSWNTYTSRFEGTVTKSTPQTVTYGAAVTGSEATYGITNFAMNNTEVVTWTTGTFDVLKPFLITGDLLGAFAAIPAQLLGASVAWTLFMIGFSGAIYSYYGAERTFVVWLIGWGLFSGVVRGEAAMFGLFLLCLGGGLIMARMWMGSRSG